MKQKENKNICGHNSCGYRNGNRNGTKRISNEELEKLLGYLNNDDADDECNSEDDEDDVCECDFDTSNENSLLEYAVDSIDISAFTKGVESVSELCGKISALTAVGLEPGQALAYLSNVQDGEISYKNNVEIAKIQADAQKDVSKATFMRNID